MLDSTLKPYLPLAPNDQNILNSLQASLFASAMLTMQKTQCNSRYVCYKSPSIVSVRLSPDYFKSIESRHKEKKSLPPIESTSKRASYFSKYSKEHQLNKPKLRNMERFSFIHKNLEKTQEKEKEASGLEVTGMSTLHPLEENLGIDRKINNSELRKMSVSLIENERRERFYEKYTEKQQMVMMRKRMSQEARISEVKNLRCRPRQEDYSNSEDNIKTTEISLQTCFVDNR